VTGLAERVAQNAPALLVYLDVNLRILFASGYCRQLLGYEPGEIRGRPLVDFVDAGTLRYARSHVAELERGNTAPRKYVLRHKDGSPRYCQVHATVDRNVRGGSVGYFACTSDIPAISAVRAAQRGAFDCRGGSHAGNRQLLAAMPERGRGRKRARRDFFTHAEHELRTPLASVIAALELLGDGALPGPATEAGPFVGVALENAHRLSRRVERLLEVERIELGIAPLHKVAINLGSLMAAAVTRAREDAQRRGVRIAGEYGDGNAWVSGDRERLVQAAGHLLGNAIAHTPPRGEVRVSVGADEHTAAFEIRDESPGVAEPGRALLFGGGRVDAAGFELTLGSGLGLCISKAIVDRLGGTLGCVNRRDRGALFRVTLPRVPAPQPAEEGA
jgi:PAS domain S-box-containing protein